MSDSLTINPAELVVSPLLERIATKWDVLEQIKGQRDHTDEHAELLAEWQAFVDDVRVHGVKEKIKVSLIKGKLTVLSGRHRRRAAIEAGVLVPYELVPESEALTTIESSMMLCNAYTKGQRAYVAVLLHPEVATEAAERQTAALKKGQSSVPHSVRNGEPSALSAEGLATKFGVSVRLIEQACQLFRELDKSKTLRIKHEWRVFAGFGLGAIIAGLAGDQSTTGKPRNETRSKTVIESLAPLNGWFTRYKALKGEAKDNAFTDAAALLAKREDVDFIEFIAELAEEARKLRQEQLDTEEEEAP